MTQKKRKKYGAFLAWIPLIIVAGLLGLIIANDALDLNIGGNGGGSLTTTTAPANTTTAAPGGTTTTTTTSTTTTAPFDGGYAGVYPTCIEGDIDFNWLCICMYDDEAWNYYADYPSVWMDEYTLEAMVCYQEEGPNPCSIDALIVEGDPTKYCYAVVVECTGGCSCMNGSDAYDLYGQDIFMHLCSDNLCGLGQWGDWMYCFSDDVVAPGATVTVEPCISAGIDDDASSNRPQAALSAIAPILALIIIALYAFRREKRNG